MKERISSYQNIQKALVTHVQRNHQGRPSLRMIILGRSEKRLVSTEPLEH